MFSDFLNQKATIIKKTTVFNDGLATANTTMIDDVPCRISSPNQRDLQLIHRQITHKQIWKVYLPRGTDITMNDTITIRHTTYTPLVVYNVQGRKNIHHTKLIVTQVG